MSFVGARVAGKNKNCLFRTSRNSAKSVPVIGARGAPLATFEGTDGRNQRRLGRPVQPDRIGACEKRRGVRTTTPPGAEQVPVSLVDLIELRKRIGQAKQHYARTEQDADDVQSTRKRVQGKPENCLET